MDKTKLNDAILALQKAFNTSDEGQVQRAISFLHGAIRSGQRAQLVRADKYKPTLRKDEFVPSGIEWFDDVLSGGARRQELILIGGETSIGKTHFLSFIAGNYAGEGLKVAHFNGEDILNDIDKMYKKGLDKRDLENVYYADINTSSFDERIVEQAIDEMQGEKFIPDVIVLDHLDIMSVMSNREDWQAVSELTRGLKFMAKRHNAIILTASQMNFTYKGGPVGLSRLHRGKVSKAMHCDVILLIDNVYKGEYKIEVAKLRGRRRKDQFITLRVDLGEMEIER